MNDSWVFVDTNILVYAYDASAEEKHRTALGIVRNLWKSGKGILSTQVLQEFFVTVVQKIPRPIDDEMALGIIRDLTHWRIVVNDVDTIIGAISIRSKHRLSFWDSMIVVAAISGGADILLTEDLSHHQEIGEIRVQNPFL